MFCRFSFFIKISLWISNFVNNFLRNLSFVLKRLSIAATCIATDLVRSSAPSTLAEREEVREGDFTTAWIRTYEIKFC